MAQQRIDIEEIRKLMQKPETARNAQQEAIQEKAPDFELDDDGEEYMPVGTKGLLAASQKLLAINRGLTDPDERDSMKFQKVYRINNLVREGIKMDAGKVARTVMYRAAKRKDLKGMEPGVFNPYIERVTTGNPLTSPLEEINPMHLVENARRISRMGPGGLKSSESITEDAQSVHPSQFGFISTIEGPECHVQLPDSKVLTRVGWLSMGDVTMETELACRVDGRLEFHKPERVIHEHYKGPVYGVRHMNASLCVTPNHRFLYKSPSHNNKNWLWGTAEQLYGKVNMIPCTHDAYLGSDFGETIELDKEHVYNRKDWCSLLGWVLSEGSINVRTQKEYKVYTVISQVEDVHPDEYKEIVDLLDRMGIPYYEAKASLDRFKKHGYTKHVSIHLRDEVVNAYFSQYKYGAYKKWIPEEVFEWSVECRQELLRTLLAGGGRINKTHTTYCTVSEQLARDVERLAIGLGYSVTFREEPDKRPHVKTTNYAVALLKTQYRHLETHDKRYYPYWYKKEYDGMVHCATVPGGMLFHSAEGRPGVWSGNSERAGIDVRVAYGAKLGSDGRLYQKFYDRHTKRNRWMSAADLDGLTVKLPD